MNQLLTSLIFLDDMKKRHLQTNSNYKFQQQQKNREEYKKIKEAKEKFKKTPLDVSEELDYIKRLLSGEDVGNFGPEDEEIITHSGDSAEYWSSMTLSQFLRGKSSTQTKEHFPF